MSTINGFDSNSVSTLFSSLGTSTNNSNNSSSAGLLGINLLDYASIKNGSYGKLMKSYYELDDTNKTKDPNSKNDTDDTDAKLRSIKDSSNELKKSTAALYNNRKQ